MKIVILGGSGMLGSMVVDWFRRDRSLSVVATARSQEVMRDFQNLSEEVEWRLLNADHSTVSSLLDFLAGADWVINCIGITKPYIHEDKPAETDRAIRINALFPHRIAEAASIAGFQVLQIATDCVYSGTKGKYVEQDQHDALDVYGKTKSLGEVRSESMHHLRVSIIGPEPLRHAFLLEWFLNQSSGSSVKGFTNHEWNGITTLHFARLCHGIIRHRLNCGYLQHVLPNDAVSKAELLQCFAHSYHRPDIQVLPIEAPTTVDRTLGTSNPSLNQKLWEAAGCSPPPTVEQMVGELAQFDGRFLGQKFASASD
jgi:dTDP-4-dehydrorhamnose reductase